MAQEKDVRKIKLRYPYDDSGKNDMNDGKYHSIIPSSLYRFVIANRDFYLLHCYDENYNCLCMALLTVCNGILCNVPLDNYNEIEDLLDNVRTYNVSCDALPDKISLAQNMSLDSLIYCAKTKSDKIILKYYFPYNMKNYIDVKNRIFCSKGAYLGAASKIQHCYYDKIQTHPIFLYSLKKELMNNYERIINNESFEINFSLNIPNGVFSEVIKDNDALQIQLIPGVRQYTIFVTPNVVYDKLPIDYCSSIEIDALASKYDGLREQNRVFRDGFYGDLPIEFKDVYDENKHKNKSIY